MRKSWHSTMVVDSIFPLILFLFSGTNNKIKDGVEFHHAVFPIRNISKIGRKVGNGV